MGLERFIKAQENDYETALAEIKGGRKRTHWMWYTFPQIAGLGQSEMAKRYAITDIKEAESYLQHPVLAPRLIKISQALLTLETKNANEVMGSPDDVKLKSSMTLFSLVPNADAVFNAVLDKFYDGQKDEATLKQLE